MISRRHFLSVMAAFTGGWILSRPNFPLASLFPHFYFTQLKYRGGQWDPNSRFVEAIVEELELRTSIDASKQRHHDDDDDCHHEHGHPGHPE